MNSSPFSFFDECFQKAKDLNLLQYDAMALVTSRQDATPSARMVLLKGVKDETFRFFSNYDSRKAGELSENPKAQLLFYWAAFGRQIRVEGTVEKTSTEDSDEYWFSRRRESRIGAIASKQSRKIESIDELRHQVAAVEKSFEGKEVVRPSFWGGFALTPHRFEFWEDGEFRLHERIVYTKSASGSSWEIHRLSP